MIFYELLDNSFYNCCFFIGRITRQVEIYPIKKKWDKAVGIIASNHEGSSNSRYRLGGNINTPVLKFITKDGREIFGSPVIGFITQYEIIPLVSVNVFYDPRQPEIFCIDFV